MADFNAVASAIATRFAAANVTQPSGERNIVLSTSELPATIVQEPTVLVFPPSDLDFTYKGGATTIRATYPVRFFLFRIRNNARNAVLVNKWLGSLYRQMLGKVQLDLGTYVAKAEMSSMGAARITFGADEFEAIAMEITVDIWEATNATA